MNLLIAGTAQMLMPLLPVPMTPADELNSRPALRTFQHIPFRDMEQEDAVGDGPGSSYELFPVTLAMTSGATGGPGVDCAYVYTVTDLDSTEVGTGVSPEAPRITEVEYVAATTGLAYYNGTTLVLAYTDEAPLSNEQAMISKVQYDVSTHKFQYKKRILRVLEVNDEDAEWSDIVTLTECDDT